MTLIITGAVIALCLTIRWHYDETREQLRKIDALFSTRGGIEDVPSPPPLDPQKPTAVFSSGRTAA